MHVYTCETFLYTCLTDLIVFQVSPESSLSEHDHKYNKEPTLNDKVHVLVSVLDANKIKLMSDDIIKQMRTVRLAARDMGKSQAWL